MSSIPTPEAVLGSRPFEQYFWERDGVIRVENTDEIDSLTSMCMPVDASQVAVYQYVQQQHAGLSHPPHVTEKLDTVETRQAQTGIAPPSKRVPQSGSPNDINRLRDLEKITAASLSPSWIPLPLPPADLIYTLCVSVFGVRGFLCGLHLFVLFNLL